MDPKNNCWQPERHDQHVCVLHNKGKFEEVAKLTGDPTVTCSFCLVNANSPDDVCSPTTLQGFEYSDNFQRKQVLEGDTSEDKEEN